jgi:hypothetical protein
MIQPQMNTRYGFDPIGLSPFFQAFAVDGEVAGVSGVGDQDEAGRSFSGNVEGKLFTLACAFSILLEIHEPLGHLERDPDNRNGAFPAHEDPGVFPCDTARFRWL